MGKSFKDRLLNLFGYEIWPPTHNDPTIKGPPPRILSRRQREALEKMRREKEEDDRSTGSNCTGAQHQQTEK